MLLRRIVLPCLFLSLAAPVRAQPSDVAALRTRAEATDYRETSRYDDVAAFVEAVAGASDRIHATTFGYTHEGRPLPLVVFGDVEGAGPEAVRASGKTRVFVQANIHAGEVCGKEAVLMLLRDLAAGRHAAWADSLVLLAAPIYNADGNERVRLTNRPGQYGPIGGMGQRPNAQGLDLNRDHMKLDSPEARSLVGLFNQYDPHVIVDLHTTNGTYHAYHLTYSPPLHPNTPASIDALLREAWLPEVTRRVRDAHGWETYYYGNLPWPNSDAERGWYTFDHRPRFNNNYAGLRNRFGILSEAYAYASFEERVLATRYFVEEVLGFAHRNAGVIRATTRAADAGSVVGQELALRAEPLRSGPVDILLGEVEEIRNPYSGAPMRRRLDVRRPERMPEFGRFDPTVVERAPRAYLAPPDVPALRDRLDAHGIRYRVLASDSTVRVERFRVDSVQVAGREYQGHLARSVFGAYEAATEELPAGTLLVPVDQPLGRLAFSLLEPRSDDGLAAWGLVEVESGDVYPVLRIGAEP